MIRLPTLRQHIMLYRHVPPQLDLPRIGQLGFLVHDLEDTCLRHGERLGVRTWYRPEVRRSRFFQEGRPLDLRFKIAVGYSEHVQIEAFQLDGADRGIVASEGPSEAPRLHHIGFFVGDVAAAREWLQSQGHVVLQEGWLSFVRRSKTRVAYLDTRASLGVIVELIENRFRGWRIDMPQWYVRLGALAGHVSRF